MKLYIARDINGDLYLYNSKPIWDEKSGCFMCRESAQAKGFHTLRLDEGLFPFILRGAYSQYVALETYSYEIKAGKEG